MKHFTHGLCEKSWVSHQAHENHEGELDGLSQTEIALFLSLFLTLAGDFIYTDEAETSAMEKYIWSSYPVFKADVPSFEPARRTEFGARSAVGGV